MAMFARRALQTCIDESMAYASGACRLNWVTKLNSSSHRDYAAVEWEMIILHALSKHGYLLHEPSIVGSQTKLDVHFSASVAFAAEIVTVSDKGLFKQNPVKDLEKHLRRICNERGLSKGSLTFSATDLTMTGSEKRAGSSLVPPIEDFEEMIFNDSFYTWLESLKRQETLPSTHQVLYNNPRSVINFQYSSGRTGVSCVSHTNFRTPTSKTRNPLFKALHDKATQIKRSRTTLPSGIIVCDGGARAIAESWAPGATTPEIVFEFLRRHTSVKFVAIFALRNQGMSIRQSVNMRLYVEKEDTWVQQLNELLRRVIADFPVVLQNAENASGELKFYEGKHKKHFGGIAMKCGPGGIQEFTMSARTLLELLSGRIAQSELIAHYKRGGHISLFEELARSGMLISDAHVRRRDDDDDDIVFKFRGPDAATSK